MATIHGTQQVPVTLTITDRELGYAIMDVVQARIGPIDDAGCDWSTTTERHTIIANELRWVVSRDPVIATLVDAANILICGEAIICCPRCGQESATFLYGMCPACEAARHTEPEFKVAELKVDTPF